MQVYYFRNAIVLVIVSTIFSLILMVSTLMAFINKTALPVEFNSFIIFFTMYNSCLLIAFYCAYRKRDYAFMSPKKYQKAIKMNEKSQENNQKLIKALQQFEGNQQDFTAEEAVVKVIEILSSVKRNI